MFAGERSESTPIGGDRWGDHEISDDLPISDIDLKLLKASVARTSSIEQRLEQFGVSDRIV